MAILSLCILNAFRIPFVIRPTFQIVLLYFSTHAAVVPTRLLIAHPPPPALGTYTRWRWSILFWYTRWRWSILFWYTRWRWSILFWYTGWRWSILYLYTGWRWSILYSEDVVVEQRRLETCDLTCGYSFPMHI